MGSGLVEGRPRGRFRAVRLASVAALAVGFAFGALVPGASAGITEAAAPLTIVMTVSGPVPAGTAFTVQVACGNGAVPDGGSQTVDVTFDASGQPTSPDVITFADGPGTCTVTQIADGGAATTTYACEGSIPEPPPDDETSTLPPAEEQSEVFPAQEEPEAPVCPAAGPQSDPITVNIETPDQEATVTVSNTFVTAQPVPAARIVAQPAFTG